MKGVEENPISVKSVSTFPFPLNISANKWYPPADIIHKVKLNRNSKSDIVRNSVFPEFTDMAIKSAQLKLVIKNITIEIRIVLSLIICSIAFSGLSNIDIISSHFSENIFILPFYSKIYSNLTFKLGSIFSIDLPSILAGKSPNNLSHWS
jgi:hypothetical protein